MIKKIFTTLLTAGLAINSVQAQAQDKDKTCHTDHDDHIAHHDQAHLIAPIGTMGTHLHHENEWMITYKTMHMEMDGLRKRDKQLNDNEVIGMPNGKTYPVVPDNMQMEMHMFGAMYGLNDNITLTAMVPWIKADMKLNKFAGIGGGSFKVRSEGLGDIKLGALFRLNNSETSDFIFNLGFSLPTGEFNEEANVPLMAKRIKLGYPMQVGAGTYAIMPGFTYTSSNDHWAWGLQAIANINLGRNSQAYSKGDSVNLNSWLSRKITTSFAVSTRLEVQSWKDYDGHDDDLEAMKMMNPVADSELRSGTRADVYLGLTYLFTEGALKNQNFSIEVGTPVFQNIDGPNLETDYKLIAGWQFRF
ncbi:MAG: transporter [Lentisphaeraceae bacterium]|nr:transporter [Lentisphaeraceae bacterium]